MSSVRSTQHGLVLLTVAGCLSLGMATSGHAALIAYDNAADPAYDDGWQAGDNGGIGFQPWVAVAPATINSSMGNGAYDTYPVSPIVTSDRAWNIRPGNSGDLDAVQVFATRGFTGSLDIGQTVQLDFDWGGQGGGWGSDAGFSFLGADGSVRFTVARRHGASQTLHYFDGGGEHDLGVVTRRSGVRTELTLVTADTFSVKITTGLDDAEPNIMEFTGTLAGTAGSGLTTLSLYKKGDHTGSGDNRHNLLFNNLAIVPEPSALTALGAGALLLARRRRK